MKKYEVLVLGGGFVGQLVQLAVPKAHVIDGRKNKPQNHLDTRVGPQYLWKPIPGVPYDEFDVTTQVDGQLPSPDRILAYKTKIGKENDGGDWNEQFQPLMKGYTSHLPVPIVEYDREVVRVDLKAKRVIANRGNFEYEILVNTLPLSLLLRLIDGEVFRETDLRWDAIFMREEETLQFEPGMRLNYLSNPNVPYYRVTHSGNKLYYESLTNQLGCRRILPGKIHRWPMVDVCLGQLATHQVYCVGRFAEWDPDQLAHQSWDRIVEWKGAMKL